MTLRRSLQPRIAHSGGLAPLPHDVNFILEYLGSLTSKELPLILLPTRGFGNALPAQRRQVGRGCG